jgi:hypothetical protein
MLFFKRLQYAVQFFYCMRGRKILLHYAGERGEEGLLQGSLEQFIIL